MPEEEALDRINRAVARLLRLNASRSAFGHSAEAAGVSLTHPAYLLLRTAVEQSPISMGELARQVNMDPGTTARQIARLVDAGLVRRRGDKSDGRVSLIEPTRRGTAASEAIRSVRMHHLTASVDGWSAGDLRTLARLLTRFVDDMAATSYESVEGEEETVVG